VVVFDGGFAVESIIGGDLFLGRPQTPLRADFELLVVLFELPAEALIRVDLCYCGYTIFLRDLTKT